MDYFLAILAGGLQGVTEFLPISSSGHLILFHDLLHFNLPDDLFFDVILHLGTLVAIFVYFYQDIKKIFFGFFSSFFNWNLRNDYDQRLAWFVIIGTIPAAIAGLFLGKFIDGVFRSPVLVAVMFIIVGLLFFVVEKYSKHNNRENSSLNIKDVLFIGCAQAVALIPGTSRSGISIIAGLGRKLKREEAAKFSFLLSVPAIALAGVSKAVKISNWQESNFLILFLGFGTSAVVGYLAVKYLMKYLSHHSLNVFGWYRIIVGAVILALAIIYSIK
ncbi:MAG: undecaprenyl-diphosphate phosphatase [bacterium]